MKVFLPLSSVILLGCATFSVDESPEAVVRRLYVDVERRKTAASHAGVWDLQAPLLSSSFRNRVLQHDHLCTEALRRIEETPDATMDSFPAECEASPITCVNGILTDVIVGEISNLGEPEVVVTQAETRILVTLTKEDGVWKVDAVQCL